MKLKYHIKRSAEHIPYYMGKWTSYIPFSMRLGSDYGKFRNLIVHNQNTSARDSHGYLIENLRKIVKYAQSNITFYKELYGKSPITIESIKDFEQLPVISKSQVRNYTEKTSGAMLVNTGGSSGEPLSLYLDKNAWAREWAHMHYIWGLRGYKHTDLMITMLGKNLGTNLFKYNAVHNEIRINPYLDIGNRAGEIVKLFKKYPIKYFQGYPSAIYNFFKELEPGLSAEEKKQISSKIKSCFFSSEYPLPYMVDYLRGVWSLNYISWYGHSEMCILAYDDESNGTYKPFLTYGFAEDINGTLCGTSFHNYDMPLIRYSTSDFILSHKNDYGIVESFKINGGRKGDFLEDRYGKKLPLTAILFGRHHKIFNIADYVQVLQVQRGTATLYVSFGSNISLKPIDLPNYFDMSDVSIEFKYIILKEPIRTKGGKLKLRLLCDDIQGSGGVHK